MSMEIHLRMLGVRELLHLPATKRLILDKATRIAQAADAAANDPNGHEVETGEGIRRARASVITATHKAMWKEATQRTLTRSIGAGRG
jgi:hypothetical protein